MVVSLCIAIVMLFTNMLTLITAIPHCMTQKTDGSTLALPDDLRGRETVLIVAYTQQAKKPAADWSDALLARSGEHVHIVIIAALDRVPWFARGIVRKAIIKEVGPPQAGKPDFVTTFEGRNLRNLAPVVDDNIPLIISLNHDGAILSAARRAFSTNAVSEIEHELYPAATAPLSRGTL